MTFRFFFPAESDVLLLTGQLGEVPFPSPPSHLLLCFHPLEIQASFQSISRCVKIPPAAPRLVTKGSFHEGTTAMPCGLFCRWTLRTDRHRGLPGGR